MFFTGHVWIVNLPLLFFRLVFWSFVSLSNRYVDVIKDLRPRVTKSLLESEARGSDLVWTLASVRSPSWALVFHSDLLWNMFVCFPAYLFTGFVRPLGCCLKRTVCESDVRALSILLRGPPAPAGWIQIGLLGKMGSICSCWQSGDTQQTGSSLCFLHCPSHALPCFSFLIPSPQAAAGWGAYFIFWALGALLWPLGAGCFSSSFCTRQGSLVVLKVTQAGKQAGKQADCVTCTDKQGSTGHSAAQDQATYLPSAVMFPSWK